MKTLLFLFFGAGKRGRPREEVLNLDEVVDGEMRVTPTLQRAEEGETHPSGGCGSDINPSQLDCKIIAPVLLTAQQHRALHAQTGFLL